MNAFTVDLARLGYEQPLPHEHPVPAVRDWADHVAAGRIGTPPPPPPPGAARDYGCAGLAAILSAPRARIRA